MLKLAGFLIALALAGDPRSALSWSSTVRATPAATIANSEDCCRICTKGKACGDSCISRDKTCRKGPGCACDG